MSVIETNQPFAIDTVQGERVTQSMRAFGRDEHPPKGELDPISALWIDHENLPNIAVSIPALSDLAAMVGHVALSCQ
jgi:hypothetical protein